MTLPRFEVGNDLPGQQRYRRPKHKWTYAEMFEALDFAKAKHFAQGREEFPRKCEYDGIREATWIREGIMLPCSTSLHMALGAWSGLELKLQQYRSGQLMPETLEGPVRELG